MRISEHQAVAHLGIFLFLVSMANCLPVEGGDEDISTAEGDTSGRSKRGVTMEFNGVRVSYPQYLRLVRLSEKVQKLDSVIEKLQQHRSEAELSRVPQYNQLVELRESLRPLLPGGGDASSLLSLAPE